MAGCCGGSRQRNTEYEVTRRDGSSVRVATVSEARIVIAQDGTEATDGRRRQGTFKVVPKAKQ